MATTYTVKRGATLVVPLEAVGAVDGDLAIVIGVDAGLKPTRSGFGPPAADVARAATFVATARAATEDVGPGWNLTLTDEQTAALAPGYYVMDAELALAGGATMVTEPLKIRVEQTVSA